MKNPAAPTTTQRDSEEQNLTRQFIAASHPQGDPLLDRSTDTKAQLRRILAALRRGPKSTDELRALGIYQVSARIFGLRALGYSITSHLFDDYSTDGYQHQKMARYTLNEPGECDE
jgi:hypothetical protein